MIPTIKFQNTTEFPNAKLNPNLKCSLLQQQKLTKARGLYGPCVTGVNEIQILVNTRHKLRLMSNVKHSLTRN